MSDSGWRLVESDAIVLTELIERLGCEGVEARNVPTLDLKDIKNLSTVYGLIFWYDHLVEVKMNHLEVSNEDLNKVFFTKNNAYLNTCKTESVLSVLMNSNDIEVNLGKYLKELKQKWRTLDATNNWNELYNDSTIREIHNSVARNDVIDKGGFRFMSYVTVDGKVYELNTLKENPFCLAAVPEGEDWVDVVQPFIKDRIMEYIQKKTDYKLMAIVENHQLAFKRKMAEIANTKDMNHEVQTELNQLLTLAHNEQRMDLMEKKIDLMEKKIDLMEKKIDSIVDKLDLLLNKKKSSQPPLSTSWNRFKNSTFSNFSYV